MILKKFIDKQIDSIEEYRKLGGFQGLELAKNMKKEEIIEEIKRSELRGRAGAGFSTGFKLEMGLEAPAAAQGQQLPPAVPVDRGDHEADHPQGTGVLDDPGAVRIECLDVQVAMGVNDLHEWILQPMRRAGHDVDAWPG